MIHSKCVHSHVFTWLVKVRMFWVCPLSIQVCPRSSQTCPLSVHCWLWNEKHSETILEFYLAQWNFLITWFWHLCDNLFITGICCIFKRPLSWEFQKSQAANNWNQWPVVAVWLAIWSGSHRKPSNRCQTLIKKIPTCRWQRQGTYNVAL